MRDSCRSQQRVEIIKIYYRNLELVASTLRALRPIYGRYNRSNRSTIERLVEKFDSTGTVQNVPVSVRQRSARSVENIAAAEASVAAEKFGYRRQQKSTLFDEECRQAVIDKNDAYQATLMPAATRAVCEKYR